MADVAEDEQFESSAPSKLAQRPLPSVDVKGFRRRGYAVAKGVLDREEARSLRDVAREVMADLERKGLVDDSTGPEGTVRVSKCDLLSMERMRSVLLDPRVLGVVRRILGGEPTYFGDSSLRIGGTGLREWHEDHIYPTRAHGSKEPYRVLRCGLYLQDHSRHSGGLGVRPYSHRVHPLIGRRLPPRLVSSEAGDLVLWDLRTIHLGEAVRFRPLPSLPLSTRVQGRLSQRLRLPEESDRIVTFMTFGLAGEHFDSFVDYLKTRDYMREAWSCSSFGPEVLEEAAEVGLKVTVPVPDYGVPSSA